MELTLEIAQELYWAYRKPVMLGTNTTEEVERMNYWGEICYQLSEERYGTNDPQRANMGLKKEYTTLYRCSNELFAKYNMVSGYKHTNPRCETLRDDSEKCGGVGREWTKQNKWIL